MGATTPRQPTHLQLPNSLCVPCRFWGRHRNSRIPQPRTSCRLHPQRPIPRHTLSRRRLLPRTTCTAPTRTERRSCCLRWGTAACRTHLCSSGRRTGTAAHRHHTAHTPPLGTAGGDGSRGRYAYILSGLVSARPAQQQLVPPSPVLQHHCPAQPIRPASHLLACSPNPAVTGVTGDACAVRVAGYRVLLSRAPAARCACRLAVPGAAGVAGLAGAVHSHVLLPTVGAHAPVLAAVVAVLHNNTSKGVGLGTLGEGFAGAADLVLPPTAG